MFAEVNSLCLQGCLHGLNRVYTRVKQGVYRGEMGCFRPMFTGVFTVLKQGVYRGEIGCFRPMFTGLCK